MMARSKKLSRTFWAQKSKNIGKKIYVVNLKVDKRFSRSTLRTIAPYICFEHDVCAVVYIGTEEPHCRGQSNNA